ncbi:hypothetical protein MY10362_007861 [Beauveria mimosiformis]
MLPPFRLTVIHVLESVTYGIHILEMGCGYNGWTDAGRAWRDVGPSERRLDISKAIVTIPSDQKDYKEFTREDNSQF